MNITVTTVDIWI